MKKFLTFVANTSRYEFNVTKWAKKAFLDDRPEKNFIPEPLPSILHNSNT